MGKILVSSTKGDSYDKIQNLIDFLVEAKGMGATHYEMEWSHDPMWAFKWLRTYKEPTEDEIKKQRIFELKEELKKLGG